MENREKIISMVMEEYDVIDDPVPGARPTSGGANTTPRLLELAQGLQEPGRERPGNGTKEKSGDGLTDDQSVTIEVRKAAGTPELRLGSRGDPDLTEGRRLSGKGDQPDDDAIIYELLCPRVNCPEKIVICLDFSSEMDKPMFRTRAGDKFAPLKLVKRALGFYVHSKHRMDSRHQFALILLQDSAIWVRDFTSDPREMVNLLEDLEDTASCESCDLSSVFQSVYERVVMPTVDGDPLILPPPYIVRLLMIYGRSHCTMELPHKEAQRALFSSPYFFVDAFYIHEASSEDNKCEEIFESLCDLDYKGFSYIFEASRNPTKIYDFMAQLLAHPLQRPGQKDTAYKLKPRLPTEQ